MRFPKLEAGLWMALVLTACGREEPSAAQPVSTLEAESATADSRGSSVAVAEPAPPALAVRARSADPVLVRLRQALTFGRLDEARAAITAAERAPDEHGELAARLAALEGRALEALRLLERERGLRPDDPAVYAALAEVYAGEQKFSTAWDEVARGDAACGASAELVRARGVLWILKEGGAEKGLEHLVRARAADPALAFVERALAQAHYLMARRAAKAEDLPTARAHIEQSLGFDAADVDARRLSADLCAAAGDHATALATLDELVRAGEPLGAELALMHKKGALAALLARDRPLALQRFARARSLGLSDAELASGAQILADEAHALSDRGVVLYEQGDLMGAEASFRGALAFDPGLLAAENHLAVVRFKRGDAAEAARLWRNVLATAAKDGLDLPEPVHLNLAKALHAAGDSPAAVRELEAYLERTPEGPWSAATRTLLARLGSAGEREPEADVRGIETVDSPREKR